MATDRDFIDYVAEQVGLGSRLTHKRMFGEYGLYVDEKVVAFACDNTLFLKPSDVVRQLLPTLGEGDPFPTGAPYPGAKPSYFVLNEMLDDADLLHRLFEATAAGLPPSKPKPARKAAKAVKKPVGRKGKP